MKTERQKIIDDVFRALLDRIRDQWRQSEDTEQNYSDADDGHGIAAEWQALTLNAPPDSCRWVHITVDDHGIRITDIARFSGKWVSIFTDGVVEMPGREVVAWRDFPKPYRGKSGASDPR